ncbi:V-type ATP synthase subunit F [Sulfurovum sp. CS9]|uniref:V-type ATP synthase subunit F n=1 Tax=Sulfurovum sp. CS9 TaxID=3391146 RepID=UPI0039EABF23
MKLVIVGNEEECLGFSLAGVEGVIVEDDSMFVEQMQQLFSDHEIGVIAIADRYFSIFSERFSPVIEKRAVPAVVFIPSMDGTHHKSSLKEYLASILGIRL